jgi:glucokinase
MILVGDVGGTRARLTLLSPTGRKVHHEVLESREHPSLEAVVTNFLGRIKPKPKVSSAAFGVAGPVVNNRCVATNLPWQIDGRVVARRTGIKRVTLLNDLVALALGTLGVPKKKLRALGSAGVPRRRGANIAVIAAGTGLGEAILIWDEERFVPCATEGGHADFAPSSHLEDQLLGFLRERFGRVSWERVVSGAGLGNLYDFFVSVRGVHESTDNERALLSATDRNATIATLAEGRRSEAAAQAVELFASLYGAEAGNLALKSLAIGGVFVCGNIAARMADSLEPSGFMRAFHAKGRLEAFMQQIPVAVVLDSDVGLAGAARVALAR